METSYMNIHCSTVLNSPNVRPQVSGYVRCSPTPWRVISTHKKGAHSSTGDSGNVQLGTNRPDTKDHREHDLCEMSQLDKCIEAERLVLARGGGGREERGGGGGGIADRLGFPACPGIAVQWSHSSVPALKHVDLCSLRQRIFTACDLHLSFKEKGKTKLTHFE